MQDDYYLEYYSLERTNWWFMARERIFRDQLTKLFPPDALPIRILNVGAAWGATSILLQEFGEVTSVESNKDCCDYLNQHLRLPCIKGSIPTLPFEDDTFDLVCAFDVVEHVREDQLAMAEFHRVCKPAGYTFTTVPAFKALWSEHDIVNGHVRRYTMRKYLALFDPHHCRIVFTSYFNSFLFPFIAGFRIISTLLKDKNRTSPFKPDHSRVKNNLVCQLLYRIFKSETFFLKRRIPFPLGVSLLVISEKSNA